ncbi:MAG: hypothetical protein WCT85_00430 [Parachlamydiales bacterium]|jgi:hypothetical protein
MISLLRKIFVENWQRKLLSTILAFIIWFFVYNSLSTTRTISHVPIRVINLPFEKTIKGIQSDGTLEETLDLTISGINNVIDKITNKDLEIVIDLKDANDGMFEIVVTKDNLFSKNPNLNIERSIKKLESQKLIINISKLMKEKIPVLISEPIGDSPKSYQYVDIWPYKLYITVSGPEEIVKELKLRGLKLTFNLSNISEKELDAIDSIKKRGTRDVVTYYVPNSWKKISIPKLSSSLLEIDDPNAKTLRIDFIKKDFIPINYSIPVELFFPPRTLDKLNPKTITIATNEFIKKVNGLYMINIPLYGLGGSQAFMDSIKDRIHIVILVESKEERDFLKWHTQAVVPNQLEKSFIKKILSEENDSGQPEFDYLMPEEYISYRWRNYMKKFRLWQSPNQPLYLKITLENNQVVIVPY